MCRLRGGAACRTRGIRLAAFPITGKYGAVHNSNPPPTTMKSIKNLSRMTYETTAFEGWRLTISRKGAKFTRYFSDRKYGSEKKAFIAAAAALTALKDVLAGAKMVNGKHTATTVNKVGKLLEKA